MCECANTGYEGKLCEIDINECEIGKPCPNDEVCINQPGSHVCKSQCPIKNSTSSSVFTIIKGKCYNIEKKGCSDQDGCTYEEAEQLCRTVFGPGIVGKVWLI